MSAPDTKEAARAASDAAARLGDIRARMAAAAVKAGRKDEVVLVAVSKTFDAPDISPLIAAGQRVFGENRVQEAARKWPPLKAQTQGMALHLIGPLQTNKVAQALSLFDVIHTLDRPRLALALARERDGGARLPSLFIQVNTGEEPQKAGVSPADADRFIAQCREDLSLCVEGLMCIPPAGQKPAPHFALLAEIARRNGLTKLSMGMSADFETAIEHGATHVRVGSALFRIRA